MENKTPTINKEQFEAILNTIGCSSKINRDLLFVMFENAIMGAEALSNSNALGKYIPVNPVIFIIYLHIYSKKPNKSFFCYPILNRCFKF